MFLGHLKRPTKRSNVAVCREIHELSAVVVLEDMKGGRETFAAAVRNSDSTSFEKRAPTFAADDRNYTMPKALHLSIDRPPRHRIHRELSGQPRTTLLPSNSNEHCSSLFKPERRFLLGPDLDCRQLVRPDLGRDLPPSADNAVIARAFRLPQNRLSMEASCCCMSSPRKNPNQ